MIGMMVLACVAVSALILFGGLATDPRFLGALGICILGAASIWALSRIQKLTLPMLDQLSWVVLISHTVLVSRGRDPRLLAESQSLTPEITAEIAIWCLCLVYGLGRALGNLTCLRNLWGAGARYGVLLLFAALASALYAASPLITLAWTLKLLVILLLASVLLDSRDVLAACSRFLSATYWGLLLMLGQFLALGALSPRSAASQSPVTGIWRVGGYLIPSTQLATVTGMVIVLTVIEVLHKRATRFHIPVFSVSLVLLLSSIGRAGIFATCCTVGFVLTAFRRKRVGVALACAAGIVFLVMPGLLDLSWEIASRRQQTEEMTSLTGRIPLWGLSLEMIAMKPFLGWGYVSGGRVDLLSATGNWPTSHAHNVFLEMALSLGLVGFVLLGRLLWKTFSGVIEFLRAHWNPANPDPLSLAALKVLSLVLLLTLSGMFDAGFSGPPRYEMSILIGCVFSVDLLRQTRVNPR